MPAWIIFDIRRNRNMHSRPAAANIRDDADSAAEDVISELTGLLQAAVAPCDIVHADFLAVRTARGEDAQMYAFQFIPVARDNVPLPPAPGEPT